MNDETLIEEQQEKRKKMPKVLKVFLIIFIIIGILIGTFFLCFYVKDKTQVSKDPDLKIGEQYNDALSISIDKTKETKKMSFSLHQYVVNSITYQAVDSLDSNIKKYIENVYLLFEDNNEVIINLNLKYAFFATKVSINSTVELYQEEGEANGGLRIKLNEIKIGRIPGFANLFTFIGKKVNLPSLISSSLEKVKLHIDVNLDNREIIYTYDNLHKDLNDIIIANTEIGEGTTKLELFQDLLSHFLSDDFISYKMVKDDAIYLDLDCEYFAQGADETKKKTYDLAELKNMVSALYAKNAQSRMKNQIQRLTYYYINGYERLSSEYQAFIDTIDFSDYPQIGNYKEYKGIEELYSGETIDSAIANQLSNTTQIIQKINNGENILDISEENISTTIRSKTKIMGYASILERIENNKLIYNFLMINDFYCSIQGTETKFYISASLNEYDLNFVLSTTAKQNESNPYCLDFVVKDVYLGKFQIKAETITDTINTFVNSTSNDTFSFKKEGENVIISLDLSSSLETFKQAITAANKNITFDIGSTVDHIKINCQ